jgi:preprotein translocase subunit SecG
MGTIISVLILIIAILLILVVLVQNPKGGLASNFSSSNQVMGVRKTTDFIEKATWTLAIALVVLSVVSATFNDHTTVSVEQTESELTNEANQIIIPTEQAPLLQEETPMPAGGNDAPAEEAE